ncbi:MAG TPA: hypothetical protein VFG73_02375 [Rhodanobacteraceae bacterium]|nr:hypothetical protein [Rhodanobacteraceae bacterium]
MTPAEIASIQPGDSIIFALGLEDELPVVAVSPGSLLLQVSATTTTPWVPVAGGPECLARRLPYSMPHPHELEELTEGTCP